jgi:hypothetical protein
MDLPTYSGDERRRFQRQRPAKSTVRITCQRGELFMGPNLAESLVDASEEGLGFLAREALRAGERVCLSLESVGPALLVQRLGRVAWCARVEGGRFRAGVELDTPLDYAELMAFSTI